MSERCCPVCQAPLLVVATRYVCRQVHCNTTVEVPNKADATARMGDLELTEIEARHAVLALQQLDWLVSAKKCKVPSGAHAKHLKVFLKKLEAHHQKLLDARPDTPHDAKPDAGAKKRQEIVGQLGRREISEEEAQRQLAELDLDS